VQRDPGRRPSRSVLAWIKREVRRFAGSRAHLRKGYRLSFAGTQLSFPVGGPVTEVSVVAFRDRRRFSAWVFEQRAFVVDELILGGHYLSEVRRLRRQLVARATDGRFYMVDGGANVGLATMFISAALPVAVRSAGFEPFEENRVLCEHNWRRAGHVVRPEALSDADSECVPLYLRSTTGATIVPTEPNTKGVPRFSVATARLDSVWPQLGFPRLDLLKLDVEGAEEAALSGAAATIARDRPFILSSYEHSGNSVARAVAIISSISASYAVRDDRSRRTLTFAPTDGLDSPGAST